MMHICENIRRPATGIRTDNIDPVLDLVMNNVLLSVPPYAISVVVSPALVATKSSGKPIRL